MYIWNARGGNAEGPRDPRECGLPKGAWNEICMEGDPTECDRNLPRGTPHPGPETIVAPLHVSLKIGLMMLKILLCIIEIMNILKYIRKENSYFIYIILYIF